MAKDVNAFGGFDELVSMITRVDKDPKAVVDDEPLDIVKLSKSVEDEEDETEKPTDLTPGKNDTEGTRKVSKKDEEDDEESESTDDIETDTEGTDKEGGVGKGSEETADLGEV